MVHEERPKSGSVRFRQLSQQNVTDGPRWVCTGASPVGVDSVGITAVQRPYRVAAATFNNMLRGVIRQCWDLSLTNEGGIIAAEGGIGGRKVTWR